VDAVRAAYHHGAPVLQRQSAQLLYELLDFRQQDFPRLLHLQAQRGVHYVRAGQAQVEVAREVAQRLAHRGDERHDFVLHLLLVILHQLQVEARL